MIPRSSSCHRMPNSTAAVVDPSAHRPRLSGSATKLAALCVMLVLFAGCTGAGSDATGSDTAAVTTAALTTAALTTVERSDATTGRADGAPAADRQLVAAMVDAINATAGGPVAAQRVLLEQLTHPDYLGEQQRCAQASITIGLDPVLDDLLPTPGWTPAATPDTAAPSAGVAIPTGTLYRMPVLVLVYTDVRRTGTDLTSLRISILDGRALLFPLCLN